MKRFEGIPAGRVEVTPLPNLFWTEILAEVDDLAEVQLTLQIYYLLYHKKGSPRFVTRDELASDPTLRRALEAESGTFDKVLTDALDQAQARGTILCIESEGRRLYLFNTAEGRKAVEAAARGEPVAGKQAEPARTPPVEPPNIYRLYEQQFGVMTPAIAEELKAAEQDFPPERILDAFRIAKERHARSWIYVRKLLLNWTREEEHETTRGTIRKRKPRFQGKFADLVKRRGGE